MELTLSPPPKRRNQDRARWREKCRADLSRHIEQRLGLKIDPKEVRLMPKTTDPYVWKYSPKRQHLFCKQLSKHNVGAYREICDALPLGTSIEVVPLDEQLQARQGGCVVSTEQACTARRGPAEPLSSDGGAYMSFANTIQGLEVQKEELLSRLTEAENQAKERQKTIDQIRDSYDLMTRHCNGLASTLQQRNDEALQMTQRWEQDKQRNARLFVRLQEWKSTLGAMQDKMTREIAEHVPDGVV